MPKQQETINKFNLVTGEETYSGQNAQNPATARRLQSLIPSISGELTRELGEPFYLPTNLGAKVGTLFQYQYNDTSGNAHFTQFAATSSKLFQENAGSWTQISLPMPTGVNSSTPFTDYPYFQIINNLLHFSDGTNNWIYDGPNGQFVMDGMSIAANLPALDTSAAGTFSTLIGRYYWYTYADVTTGRVHEGTSSQVDPVAFTGVITNKKVRVFPGPSTVSTTIGLTAVTAAAPTFHTSQTGMHLWVLGVDYGAIASVTDGQHLTLVTAAPANNTNVLYAIAPQRATNFNIYASESDGSKLGKFLATIPISGNTTPYIDDQSPFQNQPGSTILDIDRPIRNDPAPPSKVIEAHKYRLFRRRETIPNRFTYTANEEVASGANGSPQESVPGTLSNTLSDLVNETAYPRPSAAIRALRSHGDALYIGTEKEIIPLWGDTIGEFALSQVTAVDGGVISRWGMESTSHGLSIFSYDRKLYLYPPISPIWALTPQDINVTDQLVEIGRSMRNKFLSILSSDIQNVRTLKYRYNTRDWLVICYQDNTNAYHTYIYDFETKGWFELQRGFVSIAVFELSPGVKILVGGGSDGLTYVVDDVTGAVANNLSLPTALYRTALIDFGTPDLLHMPDYLEVEVSNPALMDTSTLINFYLDPQNADNPGTPFILTMNPVQGEATRYRGFFSASQGGMGVLCRRLMIEFSLISDVNNGSFRGIVLKADPVSDMIK